jgi:hypothetical protein
MCLHAWARSHSRCPSPGTSWLIAEKIHWETNICIVWGWGRCYEEHKAQKEGERGYPRFKIWADFTLLTCQER